MLNIILLSGGSGTRLWPLSNEARSKQFLKVLPAAPSNQAQDAAAPDKSQEKRESMVQRTIRQIRTAIPSAHIIIATAKAQESALRAQIEGDFDVICEPERRDTAPAIMLATSYVQNISTQKSTSAQKSDNEQGEVGSGCEANECSEAYRGCKDDNCCEDDVVVVMPIDSYVDDEYFSLAKQAAHLAQTKDVDLVLLGAKPTYPSSNYGYILPKENKAIANYKTSEAASSGKKNNEATNSRTNNETSSSKAATNNTSTFLSVERFIEKPTKQDARALIEKGALWNCGVFAFHTSYVQQICAQYISDTSYDSLLKNYAHLPKISFDYAVVEKTKRIGVVPYTGTWKDLGTWPSLTQEMRAQTSGRVVAENISGTHIINELNIPLVALGIQDAIVASTPDGILVANKSETNNMKPAVQKAAEARAMHESRFWGTYKVLDHESLDNNRCSLTKHLLVRSGKQISYQRHFEREEVWVIVDGIGKVTLDGVEKNISAGDVVKVAKGQKHALFASTNLHIIEVQTGARLSEDDIERFGYFWE